LGVEVRVISLYFVVIGRIDSVISTVLFGVCERKPPIPRVIDPVLAGYKSLTGDCLY